MTGHRSNRGMIFLRQAKKPHLKSRICNSQGLPVTKTAIKSGQIFSICALVMAMISLSSCASVNVASKDDMFAGREIVERECYSYDTQKSSLTRNLKTAVPMGVLGLALGPVGSLVAGVGSGIAMQGDNTLPTKCGLTVDEAVHEASIMAYDEDSTAVWRQIKNNSNLVLKVMPLSQRGECSIQNLEMTRKSRGRDSTRFTERIEVCKNREGKIVVARRSDGQSDPTPLVEAAIPAKSKPIMEAAPKAAPSPPAVVARPASSALPTGPLPMIASPDTAPIAAPLTTAPSSSVAPSSPSALASLRKDPDQLP